MRNDFRAGLIRDFLAVSTLAALSLMVAVAINRARATPVSLVYSTPQERLETELTKLVNGTPVQLADFETVDLAQFQTIVKNRQALVLDARAPAFYQAGHVPGALNLSRQDFGPDYAGMHGLLAKFKDKPVVVYCSGGDCHDSRLVASALMNLGFSRVKVFTGGWAAWTQANEPEAR